MNTGRDESTSRSGAAGARYLKGMARRRWYLLVIAAVVSVGGTWLADRAKPPVWEARAIVYVLRVPESDREQLLAPVREASRAAYESMLKAQREPLTMHASAIIAPTAVSAAVQSLPKDLRSQALPNSVRSSVDKENHCIAIGAHGRSPEAAAALANALAEQYVARKAIWNSTVFTAVVTTLAQQPGVKLNEADQACATVGQNLAEFRESYEDFSKRFEAALTEYRRRLATTRDAAYTLAAKGEHTEVSAAVLATGQAALSVQVAAKGADELSEEIWNAAKGNFDLNANSEGRGRQAARLWTEFLIAQRQTQEARHNLEGLQAETVVICGKLEAMDEGLDSSFGSYDQMNKFVGAWRGLPRWVEGEVDLTLVEVAQRAVPTTSPLRPGRIRLLITGIVLGLLIGAGIAIGAELVDPRLLDPADAIPEAGLPLVASIPPLKQPGSLGTLDSRLSNAAGVVREMLLGHQPSPKRIAVVGTATGDGASTLARALGEACAKAGHQTLLVQADFRALATAGADGLQGAPGLVELIRDQAQVKDVLQSTAIPQLRVVTAGAAGSSDAEFLGAASGLAVLERLVNEAAVVIVDSPAGSYAESLAIVGWADATVVVARCRASRRDQLRLQGRRIGEVAKRALLVVNCCDD